MAFAVSSGVRTSSNSTFLTFLCALSVATEMVFIGKACSFTEFELCFFTCLQAEKTRTVKMVKIT